MARLTVQDCLSYIPNRFDLVLQATERARHLMYSGEDPKVEPDNDKPTVLALREIASGIDVKDLMRAKSRDEADDDSENI